MSLSFILIICLGILLFSFLKMSKLGGEFADTNQRVNNDPEYSEDNDVLVFMKNTAQSISKLSRRDCESYLYHQKEYDAFAKEAIEKGAAIVFGSHLKNGARLVNCWDVITQHAWFSMDNYGAIYEDVLHNNTIKRIRVKTYPIEPLQFKCKRIANASYEMVTKKASVGKRAAAGGVIAGPAGAVVGAISAADTNANGGVNKVQAHFSGGHSYYISLGNHGLNSRSATIYVNNKALGGLKDDFLSFLQESIATKLTGIVENEEYIAFHMTEGEAAKPLSDYLTRIAHNLP